MKEMMDANKNLHWTDDALLDRLYGLDAPANLSIHHLNSCDECRSRMTTLESQRKAFAAGGSVSDERLRAQRQVIFRRLETPVRGWMVRLAPAAATAFLLVLGVALQRPVPAPIEQPMSVAATVQSDDELFASVALLVESETPRAIDPIRGLFADQTAATEVQ